MIKAYLNQKAVWHRVIERNEYGEPITKARRIRLRWEGKRRLVRSVDGREVISEARVFCMALVCVGDRLEYGGRVWPVIAVSVVPGLDGRESHREVAL